MLKIKVELNMYLRPIILLFFVFFGVSNVLAGVGDVPAVGLVGHWPLNEASGTTITDVSGNNYTGTLASGSWTTGMAGPAVSFSGSASRINFPTALSGANFPQSGSLSFWIKGDFNSQNNLAVFDNYRSDNHIFVRTSSSAKGLQIAFQRAGGNYAFVDNLPVTANVWTHICIVWDNYNHMGYVYKNGVLHLGSPIVENTTQNVRYPVLSNWTPSNQNFVFGASFVGSADDVALYNRCLSPAEVSAVNSGTNIPSADVVDPTIPSLFAATSLTSSKINVGWGASTDAGSGIAGYLFYKNDSLYRILTSATSTFFEDGLDSATNYTYKIYSFDYSGHRSVSSASVNATTLSAPIVFKSDFEADVPDAAIDIVGWTKHRSTTSAVAVTTERARTGNKSVKINMNYADWTSANNRAEITPAYIGAGTTELTPNKDWWVEVSEFIPSDWQSDYIANPDIIWQFKGTAGGPANGTPPLSAQIMGDSVYISLQTGTTPSTNGVQQLLGSFPLAKGAWLDWVIQVNFSYTNGLVRVWQNGNILVNYNGPTLYPSTGQTNEMGPYFKAGIYKWAWGTSATQASSRTLFIDNVKIGSAMMTAVNYTPPTTQTQAEPGLKGRWKLNENSGIEAADASGNGNVAAVVSSSWGTGKEGSAVALNAPSSRITFSQNLNGSAFPATGAISFWIKGDFSSQNNLNVFDNFRTDNHVLIRTNSGTQGLQIAFQQASGNYAFVDYLPISSNVWTHVCVAWDSLNHMGYVYKNGVLHLCNPIVENAVLNTRYPVLPTWKPSNQNFIFGASLNASNAFKGSLDDIKLYNRLLSLAEINAINSLGTMPTVDATAPAQPSFFSATALTSSKVNVGWEPSGSADIAGYTLYKNDALYRILPIGNTSNFEDGLDSATAYSYKAYAFDFSGNQSVSTAVVTASTLAAPMVFKSDFESDLADPIADITGWAQQRPNVNSVAVSTEQARTGTKSVKFNFDLSNWSGVNNRAEINPSYIGAGISELTINKDWWVELSELVPTTWQNDLASNPDVIWEFKGATGGPANGTPPLSAQIMGDSVYISLQTGTTPSANGVQQLLGSFPLTKGAWMDWVIQVNFSYTNGIIRIWKNNNIVVNYSGPTLYPSTGQTNEKGPIFKAGIYKWGWGSTATQVNNRTLYVDNVKMGSAMMTTVSYAPPTTTVQAEPGMIGRWKLNENSGIAGADASGNGNTASIISSAWGTGKEGSALSLVAPSSRITFPTALSADGFPSSGSLSFWIKGDFSSQNNMNVLDNFRSDNHILVRTNSATQGLQIAFQQPNGNNAFVDYLPISNNVWTHVCIVWDSTNHMGYVYKNGALHITNPLVADFATNNRLPVLTTWTPNNQQFIFGAPLNASTAFAGALDEIRLYSRCLSLTEVNALNNLGAMPTPDATAPAQPSFFSATALTSSKINVGWEPAAATDVAGYSLYKNNTLYRILPLNNTNAFEDGLDSATAYSYKAYAFDYSGNQSTSTATVTATTLSAPMIFKADFESDLLDPAADIVGWTEQRPNTNSITASTEQARSGSKSTKFNFDIADWSSVNNRAEITPSYTAAGLSELTINKDWWVEMSEFVPTTWQNDLASNPDVIWEFKGATGGPASGTPPLSAQIIGDSVYISLQTGSTPSVNGVQQFLGSFPLTKGAWMDWVIQVNFSYTNGTIRIWKNNNILVNYSGPTLYLSTGQTNEKGPVFKAGIYKWGWGSAATQVSNRTLFVDDVKIGTAMMTTVSYTPPTTTIQAEPGMIGRWRLNENSGIAGADASGNGNTASIVSSSWISGKEGSALSFLAPSSRVTFPPSLNGDGFPSSGSLSFWIKGDFSGQNNLNVLDNFRSDNHILVRTSTSTQGLQIAFQQANGNNAFLDYLPISANVWTNVCIVWDSTNHMGYVYKNGVLQMNNPMVADFATNSRFPLLTSWKPSNQQFIFGAPLNVANSFAGALDEIKLYNRCLSPTEIAAINSLATMPAPDTIIPAQPSFFSATSLTSSKLNVGWEPSSENDVAGYSLYKNGSLYRIQPLSNTSSFEDGLDSATAYSYKTYAFDFSGNQSLATAAVTATTLSAPMVFKSDFESDLVDPNADINGWLQQRPTPSSVVVTTEQARTGSKSTKFSFDFSDWSSINNRAEITPSYTGTGTSELTINKDWWVELSEFVPTTWQNDLASNPDVIWEFKGATGGPASGTPPLSAQIIGDSVYISLQTSTSPSVNGVQQLLGSFPLTKGAWMDWVIQVNFSYTNGTIRIWKNNNIVVNYNGPTLYPATGQTNEKGPVFKAGIYKWGWGSSGTQVTNRTLFVDDVKIGTAMMTTVNYTPPTTTIQAEPGMIGRWKLNENAGIAGADASGKGNNASIVSSSWSAGNEGSAVSFVAPSSRIYFSNALNGNGFPSTGSLSFWIKGDFTNQNNLSVLDNFRNDNHILVRTSTSTQGLQIAFQQANGNNAFIDYLPISTDVWTHVCIIWDSTNHMGYVYKNGALHLSNALVSDFATSTKSPISTTWTPANQNFIFGASLNASNAFAGSLDDIKLYERPLSPAEINAINNGTTMPAVDVVTPSLPAEFAATSLTNSKINIGWASSIDAASGIAGYTLYKNASIYRILPPTYNTYLEDLLDSATTYTYKMVAFDFSGNQSATTANAAATTLSSPVIFKTDFEAEEENPSAEITGWSQQGANAPSITVSSEQARHGNKSVKCSFNYSEWNANNLRAEIWSNYPGVGELTLNKDWWVEMSEFIPTTWQNDLASNAEIIWQFHGATNGPAGGSPPLSAYVMGDTVYISLQTSSTPSASGVQQLLGSFPIVKGAWMDWVIQVNFSYTDGLIRIWKNGNIIVNYSGSTLYQTIGQTNENGPYFKAGIYKWFWGNSATQVSNRTLYIDDIKVGTAMMTQVTIPVSSTTVQAETGLVGRWKMNEGSGLTLTDASGNNREGSLTTPTWITDGKEGTAIKLNTSSSRITFPSSLSGTGFPATGAISFWIKGDFATQNSLNVFDNFRSDNHILIRTNVANQGLQIAFQQPSGAYAFVDYLPISANVWTHVCVAWDSTNHMGYVYKNGVLHLGSPIVTNAASNARYPILPTWTPSSQIFLFGSSITSSNSFIGSLDDIKLYNRCLSLSEISSINAGIAMAPKSTTVPAVPNMFATTSLTNAKINIGWEPSTDATPVAGYSVYKNGALYRILQPSVTTLLEDGLDSTQTYSYKVQAFEHSGNQSSFTTNIATSLVSSPVIFKTDFETDLADSTASITGWSQQRPSVPSIAVTTEKARTGNKSVRFKLKYNEWTAANNRSEIAPSYTGAGISQLTLNKDWWVELSENVPTDWQNDVVSNPDIIWQFKGASGGPSSGTPPLSAQIMGDSVYISLQTGTTASTNGVQQLLGSFPLVKGVWMDWVIKANFSYTNGAVRIWRNGSLVVNYTGPTLYPSTGQTNETGPYFKAGIYKAAWGTNATQTTSRTLYVDDIKIGSAMMTPVSYTAPTTTTQAEPGLKGRWKLDENAGIEAADASGNNYLANVTSASWSNGQSGSGVTLGVPTSRITFPSALSGSGFPGSGSLSFWIKGDFTSQNYLNIFDNYRSDNHILIRTNPSAQGLQVTFQQTNGNNAFVDNLPISANVWTHICVVWDTLNDMGYVYKNGVLHLGSPMVSNAATNNRYPVLTTWSPANQNFVFGASLNSANAFSGSLDDIKLYNRCLGINEVNAISTGSSMPMVNNVAPAVPAMFAATSLTSTKVNVGWEPSADVNSPVAGYSLYKNGSLYRIMQPNVTSLLEDPLDSTVSYSYKAVAFNYNSNRSASTTNIAITPISSPMIFKSDFEADLADSSATIAGWSKQRPSVPSIAVTTDRSRSGNKSVKVKLNYSEWSSANNRSEITPSYTGVGMTQLTLNKDWWVELSEYVPTDWQNDLAANPDFIWEFKGTTGGPSSGTPPLSAQIIGDSVYISLQTGTVASANGVQQLLGSFPLVKGVWMDWVIKVNFSYTNGAVRIWRNGNVVINYSGPTLYPSTGQSNEIGPYFKAGIYKPLWGTSSTQVSTRTLYVDDVKIGSAMMTPVTYTAPIAQAQPAAGLIGRWKLDENNGIEAADASGNNNLGSVVSSAWSSGQATSAITMVAPSSRITFPPVLSGAGFPANGSLSFWIKGDFTSQNYLNVFDNFRSDNHILIRTNPSIQGLQVSFQQANGNNAFVANLPVSANVWTHICVVWDTLNHMGYVYKNGAIQASNPFVANAAVNNRFPVLTTWTPNNQNFVFGASLNSSNAFSGSLDDIKLYNRCLAADEIIESSNGNVEYTSNDALPSTPSLFAVTPLTSTKINVGWANQTGNNVAMAGYNIYRNGGLYRIIQPNAYTLLEDGLDSTSSYTYLVQAFDYKGRQSPLTPAASATPLSAPSIFQSDFEADVADSLAGIAGWALQKPRASAIATSTEQPHGGNKSVKVSFDYSDWSSSNNRSEITPSYPDAGMQELALNKDWWVQLSEYIPSNWVSDQPTNPDFIWQFKGATGGPASGTSPLSAQVIGENIYISIQKGSTPSTNGIQQLLGNFPLVRNVWMNWTVQVNFSYTNGFIKVWMNDSLKVDYTGPTLYPVTGQTNEKGPCLKAGIYKWAWGVNATQVTNRTLFIDDVKIASSMTAPAIYQAPISLMESDKHKVDVIVKVAHAKKAQPKDGTIEKPAQGGTNSMISSLE